MEQNKALPIGSQKWIIYRDRIKRKAKNFYFFDDWLTVQRSVTLVDLQLDAPNSYLFTYNTFIKIVINILYVNK